jgi:hypothetical protein
MPPWWSWIPLAVTGFCGLIVLATLIWRGPGKRNEEKGTQDA